MTVSPKLVLVWGSTMYHVDDLPFSTNNLPDVYTQFRKVSLAVPHISILDINVDNFYRQIYVLSYISFAGY